MFLHSLFLLGAGSGGALGHGNLRVGKVLMQGHQVTQE